MFVTLAPKETLDMDWEDPVANATFTRLMDTYENEIRQSLFACGLGRYISNFRAMESVSRHFTQEERRWRDHSLA